MVRMQIRRDDWVFDEFDAESVERAIMSPEAVQAQAHGARVELALLDGPVVARTWSMRQGAEILTGWEWLDGVPANGEAASSGVYPVVSAL